MAAAAVRIAPDGTVFSLKASTAFALSFASATLTNVLPV